MREVEFGRHPNRKNAHILKFDFEPLNTKRTPWAPKMVYRPEVNLSVGASTKGIIPHIKIEFGIVKMLVFGLVGRHQRLVKATEKP
jgi:hypothetical protein